MSFRLVPLDETRLAGDPHADLPLQLRVQGAYLEPVDGVTVAEIEVRFDAAGLTDLVAQARAAQLTLARRARKEAEIVAAAGQLIDSQRTVARSDVETLQRVIVGLRELPAEDLPVRGGPRAGGGASTEPEGGGVVRAHGEGPRTLPCGSPLPRRQPGKGD